MKKFLFLAVVLWQSATANELSAAQCNSLYQAWLFNRSVEEVCNLDRCVSYQIGVIAKIGCGKVLTQSVRDELSRAVLTDTKIDMTKNGKEAFCAYSKKGHEDLKVGNKLCALPTKP